MNIFVVALFLIIFINKKNILNRHPGIPSCLQKLVNIYCEKIWDKGKHLLYFFNKLDDFEEKKY